MTKEKSVSVSLEEIEDVILECLESSGSFSFYPKGVSMLPMIRQGKDSVTISKIPEKIRKYDVILYKRDDGKFVLHRLVKTGEEFGFLGDNQYEIERGIKREQMIGKAVAFTRDEKKYTCDNFLYKTYCFLWYNSRFLRKFYGKIHKKIFKKQKTS